MSHSLKTEPTHRFDQRYLARPRRIIYLVLITLLVLQTITVTVIVSSESTKLDRSQRLVEDCRSDQSSSSHNFRKQSGRCVPLPIRFDTKV